MELARNIQRPEELQLLLKICRHQGRLSECLSTLNSPRLGTDSPAAMGEWRFVYQKLNLLEELGHWEELWSLCKLLLERPGSSSDEESSSESAHSLDSDDGDWRVWQCMVHATIELDQPE